MKNQFRTGRYRYLIDLVYELVKRDIKLRYKKSLIGIGWSLLNPLAMLIIFAVVFQLVLPLSIPYYTLFLFVGILVWTWFQSSWVGGTTVIVDNRALIRQPGFPPAILPLVPLLSNLFHFILALPILLIFIAYSGLSISWTVIYLPLLFIVQILFTSCLTYLSAAMHVTFRDTAHIVNIAAMFLFYLSAIFYDVANFPEATRQWFYLNPIIFLLDGYRDIFINAKVPNLLPIAVIGVLSLLLLIITQKFFVQSSYRFVEEL